MQFDLTGRVVLVTGAYHGIGYACAEACLAAGASVMVHARREEDLPGALARLASPNAAGVAGDLKAAETPKQIVAQTVEHFGRLDGLVNNAALLTRSNIEAISYDHLQEMFAVNVTAPLLLIQAALPHLDTPQGGAVVNIGSINAHCGAPHLLAYSATKGALMTATRNLGDALGGHNVRVNQINVGWTLTENERKIQRAEGQPEDWLDRLPREFAPRGTILMPEEIGAHTVFWLSPASAPANGQVYELEQYPLIGRNRIVVK